MLLDSKVMPHLDDGLASEGPKRAGMNFVFPVIEKGAG
jgi:hypothetical protein